MDLNKLSDLEIVKLIKDKAIGAKELTDARICPTCFDKKSHYVLYGDKKERMLYEDDDMECFLITNPRSLGHTIISSKKHYKDLMELPNELVEKTFLIAKKLMLIIKEVYGAESVYLCTMCDGPMNHFHVQLIPRYQNEKRGSSNFVKERKEYYHQKDKISEIRKKLSNK